MHFLLILIFLELNLIMRAPIQSQNFILTTFQMKTLWYSLITVQSLRRLSVSCSLVCSCSRLVSSIYIQKVSFQSKSAKYPVTFIALHFFQALQFFELLLFLDSQFLFTSFQTSFCDPHPPPPAHTHTQHTPQIYITVGLYSKVDMFSNNANNSDL